MFVTDKPMIHEIGYKTYLIDCFGMGTPILYVGEKKALLVDCGSGNCDMRGIAEKIARMPVELALTRLFEWNE